MSSDLITPDTSDLSDELNDIQLNDNSDSLNEENEGDQIIFNNMGAIERSIEQWFEDKYDDIRDPIGALLVSGKKQIICVVECFITDFMDDIKYLDEVLTMESINIMSFKDFLDKNNLSDLTEISNTATNWTAGLIKNTQPEVLKEIKRRLENNEILIALVFMLQGPDPTAEQIFDNQTIVLQLSSEINILQYDEIFKKNKMRKYSSKEMLYGDYNDGDYINYKDYDLLT